MSPGARWIAALAIATSGCDPGYDVTVKVVDAAGAPVAGVEVVMDCPPAGLMNHQYQLSFGHTDQTGTVHQAQIGEVRLECWLHAPQRGSDRLDVGASCQDKHGFRSLCSKLSATLHLPKPP